MTEQTAQGPSLPGATAASTLQGRAARGALWTLIHVATSIPVAFAANAVTARFLGAADYGTLAALTLTLSIAGAVTDLGVTGGTIQFGAASYAKGDQEQTRALLQKSLGFHVFAQMPLMLLVTWLLAFPYGWAVVIALSVSTIVSSTLSSAAIYIGVTNRTAGAAKLAIAQNLAIQTGVTIAAVATSSPAAVWATRTVVQAAAFPSYLLALRGLPRRDYLRARLPRELPEGFWRFCLYSAGSGIVTTLVFSRSELFLLQRLSAPETVGVFALAFGLAQQVAGPVQALLNPLNPAVAGIVAAHPERATDAAVRALRISSLFGAAIVTAAFPALHALIPFIYGREFASAAPIFVALGVVSCLQAVINPLLAFNAARHGASTLLKVNALALASNVVAAFVLIPGLGLWGAAAANACGQVTMLWALFIVETRHLRLRRSVGARLLLPFAASSVVVSSCVAAPPGRPALLAAVVVTAAGVIVAVTVVRYGGQPVTVGDVEAGARVLPARLRPVVYLAGRALGAGSGATTARPPD